MIKQISELISSDLQSFIVNCIFTRVLTLCSQRKDILINPIYRLVLFHTHFLPSRFVSHFFFFFFFFLPLRSVLPDVNMSSWGQQTPVCEKTQLNLLAAASSCVHMHPHTHTHINSRPCGVRSHSSISPPDAQRDPLQLCWEAISKYYQILIMTLGGSL